MTEYVSGGLAERRGAAMLAGVVIAAGGLTTSACTEGVGRNAPPPASFPERHPAAPQPYATDSPLIGFDVSFYQCDGTGTKPLPPKHSFAIVGLNKGKPNNANPCRTAEFTWAQTSSGAAKLPKAALYVNTGNPGPKDAEGDWPKSGKNELGSCDGSNSAACAYQYGQDRAKADLQLIPAGALPNTELWLDVETDNTWQADKFNNRAALVGMTEVFKASGHPVGIYTAVSHWQQIIDAVPASSGLHGMDMWIAGAEDLVGAQANCRTASVTAGKVVMAQYQTEKVQIAPHQTVNFDADLSCQ